MTLIEGTAPSSQTPSSSSPFVPPSSRPTSQSFVILTSNGSAYFTRWGPSTPAEPVIVSPTITTKSNLRPDFIFDVVDELDEEAKRDANRWYWTGVCFHGRGESCDTAGYASTVEVNPKMGLIAIGCDE